MVRTKQADSETRRLLILAGERLIGEKGIEGISLREVNAAAGQKNKSAAHYYFGTKLGLVEAIYNYRMQQVNDRRLCMLDHADNDVRALIEAWVYPMVEVMNEPDSGSHYIRFLARVSTHADNNVRKLWFGDHASGLQRIATGLRNKLTDLPEKIFSIRFGLVIIQLIHSLAEYERLAELSADTDTVSSPLFVSNLVDVLVAALQAPVNPETQLEYTTNRSRSA